jgi:hypothetical protein
VLGASRHPCGMGRTGRIALWVPSSALGVRGAATVRARVCRTCSPALLCCGGRLQVFVSGLAVDSPLAVVLLPPACLVFPPGVKSRGDAGGHVALRLQVESKGRLP